MTYGLPRGTAINYGPGRRMGQREHHLPDSSVSTYGLPAGTAINYGIVSPMETWVPVVGWKGLYEVSDQGRVRSMDRVINGRWGEQRRRGFVLVPGGSRRPHIQLCRDGIVEQVRVQTLVAEAFLGDRPPGGVLRHLNDDPFDNRTVNLSYGTYSDNAYDAVANGRHHEANKTHCKYGHEFTTQNTYIQPSTGGRRCRTCKRENEWKYR